MLQPFGYLAWAACGKDPGLSAGALAHQWRKTLEEAAGIVAALPAEQAGTAVLASTGELARLDSAAIRDAIDRGDLRFHPGRIGGAWPTMK